MKMEAKVHSDPLKMIFPDDLSWSSGSVIPLELPAALS